MYVGDASTHSVCVGEGNGNGGPGHGEVAEVAGSWVVCRSGGDDDVNCSNEAVASVRRWRSCSRERAGSSNAVSEGGHDCKVVKLAAPVPLWPPSNKTAI
jgi:hypothetical protein